MAKRIELETERLFLRRWQESDLAEFIRMNQDPEVMRYFPNVYSEEQTRNFYETIRQEFDEYGYGLYAAEEKSTSSFMGFIGFHWARFEVDFCPCVEIGWRLSKEFWNKGYATEGAKACLEHGFEKFGFKRVYSFTSVKNGPSERVMQKIGLEFAQYFDHPGVAEGHPIRPHICYKMENDRK